MIPLASITDWSNKSPWGNLHFVEQDLLLCRILIELFNDEILAKKLAFRGGTAIHKLYLSPQPRYSEDIDIIQIYSEPIGIVFDRCREIFSYFDNISIKQTRRSNTVNLQFITEVLPQVKQRIKIEINCREHLNIKGLIEFPFDIQTSWFTGNCNIITYSLEELIGTKIRALYQRKKGRDLFDIYYALINKKLDIDNTIFCYKKYMEFSNGEIPSAELYLENLLGKINDPLFISDIKPLLRPGIKYDNLEAFELFKSKIIDIM